MSDTTGRAGRLEILLGLLLEASAPVPYGGEDPGTTEALAVRFGPAPRELLVSFQQIADHLTTITEEICGASTAAVLSCSGDTANLNSHRGLTAEQIETLHDPHLVRHAAAISQVWSEIVGEERANCALKVDEYGETSVWLLLAWDSPHLDEMESEMAALLQKVSNGALRFQRKAASSRRRARWVAASRTLTDALLAGADEEEALTMVAEAARTGAGADAALIFLPSIGDEWSCEVAAGEGTDAFVGIPFPRKGVFQDILEGGHGMILRSAARHPLGDHEALRRYGPMVLAPLYSEHSTHGAIVVLRFRDREPFAPDDLPLTEAFASQTSLAMEVASARHSKALALLLEDRNRISRDLHDLAVQQLFATGMKLDFLREGITDHNMSQRSLQEGLEEAMSSLEDSVRQIRSIVHNLKESDVHSPFTEKLEREASRARQVLGFAPSLVFELDGHAVNAAEADAEAQLEEISARVSDDIADDAVATFREALSNIARHAHARATLAEVEVSGSGLTGELVIAIVDDGRGVDPSESRSSGLANMAARARLHGGSFAVGAGPRGRGTSLVWRVPLEH